MVRIVEKERVLSNRHLRAVDDYIRALCSAKNLRPHVNSVNRRQIVYLSASRPFCSTRFNNFNEGPFGFFWPCSHFCTVDGLVFR